jgi:hypothetical protein
MSTRVTDLQIQAHGYQESRPAYVSAIDGTAYAYPDWTVHGDGWIVFQELKRAGELIRELRQEVDALKAERVK